MNKIQIQRGIGTSKNGTASYAGSIELFSPELYNPKKMELGFGYGSFNTLRTYGIFNSGIINNKGLYVRVSKIYSDGFKQHASNNSQSLFLSSGLFLDKSTWKINVLAGNQKNGLAWMGVPENEINCNRTTNANSEFEKDNFSQVLFQLKNNFYPNGTSTIHSSIYYTLADGYWDFDLNNYYGSPSTDDEIYTNSLTSHLIGFFSNYTNNYKSYKDENLKWTTGIHGNIYKNDFTESQTTLDLIYNQNTKKKNEASVFNKLELKTNNFLIFGDIQYRLCLV